MSSEEVTLEDYREWLEDADKLSGGARYSGLPIGTIVQFAEHSPEKVEDWTGLEVPEELFETYKDLQADKLAHAYVCYSASSIMLDYMENSSVEYNVIHKAAAVNLSTFFSGSIKEFTDSFYDPMDMAANMIGASTAVAHHAYKISEKYEDEMDIEINSKHDFIKADILYNEMLRQGLEPEEVDPTV